MKKYIIKYADGSEQTIMQDSYKSRNEASDALMQYVSAYNEGLNIDSGDYLSVFDFKLEEVECKEVNEVITDFESAKKALDSKYKIYRITGSFDKFEDVARLVGDINTKHIDALIALNELFTIAQAWNKEDGFVPDFSDWEQDKWFPWFTYEKTTKRFVFSSTAYAPANLFAYFGSRLCFKTSERAAQFGKQFEDLYNKVFLW